MKSIPDILAVLLILTNLRLLSASRLYASITIVATQAVLLGVTSLSVNAQWGPRLLIVIGASMFLKAVVLPWLLRRSIAQAGINREVEPFVGFTLSLLVGVGLLGLCFLIADRLTIPWQEPSRLLTPVALFTVATGLFIVIARKKAVTQVLGYLAMENGIWAFGTAFAVHEPLLVEMAVLLDVFVAVFVMGIITYHISREFDHIDTDRLAALRE